MRDNVTITTRGGVVSFGISYMGTKRHLVPNLSEIIASCRDGIFLDVFSGMCTVGRAVAPRRQVWSNDLQVFSQLVAEAQFCSADAPISALAVQGLTASLFQANLENSRTDFSDLCGREKLAVATGDWSDLANIFDLSLTRAQATVAGDQSNGRYDLFRQRYAGTYFGYDQASEIDSIRCALDQLRDAEDVTPDQWRTLLLCLCMAMSKCSNSTGHFAQALYPKSNNIKKVVGQRRRSVWDEWIDAVSRVYPVGTSAWRGANKAFRSDAKDLLWTLPKFGPKPSVIYADPPYTQDQYSRYYHIYETAVLYDHPSCEGRGLYRPDRATSPFSLASKVEQAFDELIEAASRLKSCLILSYPQSGILRNSDETIPKMIKAHFGVKPDRLELPHRHSTMGGSKGATTHDVTEVIYRVAI